VEQYLRTDDKCVRVYIEVEYDIFQEHGPNTTNFILALFNQSSTIYANDGIALTVSEIFIWDTSHNYGGLGCIFTPDPSTVLGPFQTYRTTFNGDIAHLVSYDFACGGLAAGFDALCNPVTAKKMCFSGLSPELLLDYFPDYPLNPRNLHLFTHEMGHLLGSRHTHACVWNGNNTAIDGCGPCLEPPTIPGPGEDLDCDSCERPPIPANGGTIMSYCLSASGIDFNSGFHPQPRSVILNSSDDIDSGSYEASNAIYSTATIGSNQDVIYSAGNFISLEPPVFDPIGLESSFCVDASNGSTFLAYIDDCSGAISLINEQSDTKNSAVYTTEDTKERSETDELVTFKNRPNPFTGITTIEFTLKEDSSVTLSISDVTGRQITVLIDSEQQSAGTHQVTFDGNAYPAGMYYYTIQAGEYIGTQKMSLIK